MGGGGGIVRTEAAEQLQGSRATVRSMMAPNFIELKQQKTRTQGARANQN